MQNNQLLTKKKESKVKHVEFKDNSTGPLVVLLTTMSMFAKFLVHPWRRFVGLNRRTFYFILYKFIEVQTHFDMPSLVKRIWPSIKYRKLTEHGKCWMQNNQLATKIPVELKKNYSIMLFKEIMCSSCRKS